MYPRNAASPERIAIGQVILIADGTVQTSGVSVVVRAQGGAESAGSGTVSYGASSSVVYYIPTQAETNYTSFVVTAYKASCLAVSQTVITTASATSGKVVLSGETHTSAVIPTVTTNTDMRGTDSANTTTPPTAIENADALLNRDMSIGTDSGSTTVRTVRQALRFLRNKWAISGTTLTVNKEDDSTASWTAEVSTDAAADPVTGSNPAGGA
ncbi:MAG: hypothetical protein GY746_07870 [Gammaproteobacteria bacterium]|nr:hypothetical protein [Gammaproteobacteria bacterium]